MRQVLAHPSVRRVDLVDPIPGSGTVAVDGRLAHVNGGVLGMSGCAASDGRHSLCRRDPGQWDVVLMDLPDPNDDTLARLYAQYNV